MRSFCSKFTLLILSCGLAAVVNTAAEEPMVDNTDRGFIKSVYQNGLYEIQMGALGKSKSASAEVKAFGEQMIADHGKANAEVKILAASKKVELAAEPALLGEAKYKFLEMKSGADFDKAFAARMLDDQKKAVKVFEKVAEEAKDADVKAFAIKMLPTVKMHLSMAEELQKKTAK